MAGGQGESLAGGGRGRKIASHHPFARKARHRRGAERVEEEELSFGRARCALREVQTSRN